MFRTIVKAVVMLLSILPLYVFALTLPLPANGDDVVGQNFTVRTGGKSLTEIGQEYEVGVYELLEANPGINPDYVKRGSTILIPHQFILPQPQSGIVINLAELRLYYFPKGKNVVMTYPIGIGRRGWQTPTGTLRIIDKKKDPSWRPTESIRADTLARKGVLLPTVIPAGPDNPLGPYAMRLSNPEYLIHGTNMPKGVGRRVSSGCIRMHNHNVKELFENVPVDTIVSIINEPNKVGWYKGALFVESHKPLSDDVTHRAYDSNGAVSALKSLATQHHDDINWVAVNAVGREQRGIPLVVSY